MRKHGDGKGGKGLQGGSIGVRALLLTIVAATFLLRPPVPAAGADADNRLYVNRGCSSCLKLHPEQLATEVGDNRDDLQIVGPDGTFYEAHLDEYLIPVPPGRTNVWCLLRFLVERCGRADSLVTVDGYRFPSINTLPLPPSVVHWGDHAYTTYLADANDPGNYDPDEDVYLYGINRFYLQGRSSYSSTDGPVPPFIVTRDWLVGMDDTLWEIRDGEDSTPPVPLDQVRDHIMRRVIFPEGPTVYMETSAQASDYSLVTGDRWALDLGQEGLGLTFAGETGSSDPDPTSGGWCYQFVRDGQTRKLSELALYRSWTRVYDDQLDQFVLNVSGIYAKVEYSRLGSEGYLGSAGDLWRLRWVVYDENGQAIPGRWWYCYYQRYTEPTARVGLVKRAICGANAEIMFADKKAADPSFDPESYVPVEQDFVTYGSSSLDYDSQGRVAELSLGGCCGGQTGGVGGGTTYFGYGQADPGATRDHDHWARLRQRSTRTGASGTSGAGTVTNDYYHCNGDLVHRQVIDYDATGTAVREAHWHWEYDEHGRLVREYLPSVWDGTAFSADTLSGTFTYGKNATAGVIRSYEYNASSNLIAEYIQQGTSGTPIKVLENEYYTGISRRDLLRRVVRYATEVSTGTGVVTNIVEYDYDADRDGVLEASDFWDGPGAFSGTGWRRPKACFTRRILVDAVDPGQRVFVEEAERYNEAGDVVYRKEPNGTASGSLTFTQYWTETDGDGRAGKPRYVVRDANTSSPPTGYSGLYVQYFDGFQSSQGYNLVTAYDYDRWGRVTSTIHPDGRHTRYLYVDHTDVSIGGVVHPRVTETREYPHITAQGEVVGAVVRTFATPRGVTVSTRRAEFSSWGGTAGEPAASDVLVDLERTDYLYDGSGRMAEARAYPDYTYSGGAITGIDTSAHLSTEYGYHASGLQQEVITPGQGSTYRTWGFVSVSGQGYREERVYPTRYVEYVDEEPVWRLAGPISVTWSDVEGRTVRSFKASAAMAGEEPTGSETLTELSRTTYGYDWRGRTSFVRQYVSLAGLGLADVGTKGTHYLEQEMLAYDNQDRLLRAADAAGKISATVYDVLGRAVAQYEGTALGASPTLTDPNNGGGGNMVKVSETYYQPGYPHPIWVRDVLGDVSAISYDQLGRAIQHWAGTTPGSAATSSNPNASGGNLVKVGETTYAANHVDVSRTAQIAAQDTVTYPYVDYTYDALGRREWTKPQVGPWAKVVYETLGRAITQETYANGGATLLAKTTTDYDAAGRVRVRRMYAVTGGAVGDCLETLYSYDALGRQCKVTQPTGGFVKVQYDGAGRVTHQYMCASEGATTDPQDVSDDTVLAEAVYTYDEAGRAALVTTYARNHDNTTTAGPLSASWTWAASRPQQVATWYDVAGRQTHTAVYGTGGGSALSARPATAPEPSGASEVIVTKYQYDSAGRLAYVTDNKQVVTYREYDAFGRLVRLVENYEDGVPSAADDRTTTYSYNAAGQILTQTAVDPNGDTVTTDNQVTRYVYSGELTDKGCAVPLNSLLRGVIYPDSSATVDSGAFSGSDLVQTTYYPDGSPKTRTDQRGVQLTWVYDLAGRQTSQSVTAGTVSGDQRIGYAYDDLGRLATVTTYSDAGGTTVTSEVKYEYDGLGQLVKESQDHDSAVDANSLYVQYTRDLTDSSPDDGVLDLGGRLLHTRYPNGRLVHAEYAGFGDAIGRPTGLAMDNGGSAGDPIVAYSYLGDGTMVQKDYPTPDLKLTYLRTSGSDPYANLDRFGRVGTQDWVDYGGTPASIFKIHYGYDAASNRLYAERQDAYGSHSQVYGYDDLHRLTGYQAGQAEGTDPVHITAWRQRQQGWTLDAVGNQTQVQDFGATSWFTNTPNPANEYSARTARGNTGKQRPYDEFTDAATAEAWESVHGEYDAFNVNGTPGRLTVTDCGADGKALLLFGEAVGPNQALAYARFPAVTTGEVGIVFGYKSIDEYWLLLYDIGADTRTLYHVVNGSREAVTTPATYTINPDQDPPGKLYALYAIAKRNGLLSPAYSFGQGYPSGRVGVFTTIPYMQFENFQVPVDSEWADALGRWRNNTVSIRSLPDEDRLFTPGSWDATYNPILLGNLRTKYFRATFSMRRYDTGTPRGTRFVFNAKDQDDFDQVLLYHSDDSRPPYGYVIEDGRSFLPVTTEERLAAPTAGQTDVVWAQVECAWDSGQQKNRITVKLINSPTKPDSTDWDAPGVLAYRSYSFACDGGMIGFCNYWHIKIDDLTVETDEDQDGTYQTELVEEFTEDAVGAAQRPEYDAAGNLTYDGQYRFGYDAWNRLIRVDRAYWNPVTSAVADGSLVATLRYDGAGRRIVKAITNSADWNRTYHEYYDGQRLIETRNDLGQVLKQYVWGLGYIDELVQIAINPDPQNATSGTYQENRCERFFWALQDVNYNVLGVVLPTGRLIERYEYTPYGQRTVYSHGWLLADIDGDGVVGLSDQGILATHWNQSGEAAQVADLDGNGAVDLADQAIVSTWYNRSLPAADPLVTYGRLASAAAPTAQGPGVALCDIGHQGLLLDAEFGLYHNRARAYHPTLMRFAQRDPGPAGLPNERAVGGAAPYPEYHDGTNLYQYVGSNPAATADPTGLWGWDVHYALTYRMAVAAGFNCPSEVAAGANAPDEDWARRPGFDGVWDMFWLGVSDEFPIRKIAFDGRKRWISYDSESLNWWKVEMMAEWHFPLSPSGEVEPNSAAARQRVEIGIQTCNFLIFSEGLHVLQDSWAHQGRPYLYGRIGHGQGAENWWGYVSRTDGSETAAVSDSADSVLFFPMRARATGLETYRALVDFKTRCPCHCPPGRRVTSSGRAMPTREVEDMLELLFPRYPAYAAE